MEPPLGEKMELFTPITSPAALTSGPPEFPGLIAASVWIMSTYTPDPSLSAARLRPVPLTTPAVTLGSELARRNPYGFPIAIAHSPTIRFEEFPRGATGRFLASILITARSFASSDPRSFAG